MHPSAYNKSRAGAALSTAPAAGRLQIHILSQALAGLHIPFRQRGGGLRASGSLAILSKGLAGQAPRSCVKRSAGILLYKLVDHDPRVLLVHPGGPFWAKKDAGAWSIPKGEYEQWEDPLHAAIREFKEETGMEPKGDFPALGEIVQANRKVVAAWACRGNFDPAKLVSNFCEIEWPSGSGNRRLIPEVDRAGWFTLDEAPGKINPAQVPFLDRLTAYLTSPAAPDK